MIFSDGSRIWIENKYYAYAQTLHDATNRKILHGKPSWFIFKELIKLERRNKPYKPKGQR